MAKYKVFVYGSLKRGFGNNVLLRDAEFIGNDETIRSDFDLRCWGAYPAVYESGSTVVKGELYSVDDGTFTSLDGLEGYPDFYNRQLVELKSGNKAWMYFIENEEPTGEPCEEGLWPLHRR